jgi:hypothetical protein
LLFVVFSARSMNPERGICLKSSRNVAHRPPRTLRETRVPAIVHLIGFPASGKLTIARALAEISSGSGDRFVVLDNHHTANVIFAALDLDEVKPVPLVVWDRVREIFEVLLRTIEELSPPDWSFVFTNVLTDDKPSERGIVDRLANWCEAVHWTIGGGRE